MKQYATKTVLSENHCHWVPFGLSAQPSSSSAHGVSLVLSFPFQVRHTDIDQVSRTKLSLMIPFQLGLASQGHGDLDFGASSWPAVDIHSASELMGSVTHG